MMLAGVFCLIAVVAIPLVVFKKKWKAFYIFLQVIACIGILWLLVELLVYDVPISAETERIAVIVLALIGSWVALYKDWREKEKENKPQA